MTTPQPPVHRTPLLIGLIVTISLAVVYLGFQRNQGWIAHDEGLLGHSAERVLQGELPHVDFQEAYTGGLSYLHAWAFKTLGMRLTSLRLLLVLTAGLAVGAWYLIAVRFLPPLHASLTTLACVSWSFPNYFAALPSWYNLMFSSWTLWAILCYSDGFKSRYLWIAGLTTGCSLLCKIVGLYGLAASLFAILFVHLNQPPADNTQPDKRISVIVAALACGFAAMLLLLVKVHLTATTISLFVLPGMLLMAVTFKQSQLTHWPAPAVWKMVRAASLVMIATMIPVTLFCLAYLSGDDLKSLQLGIFELPRARLEHAVRLPPGLLWFGLSIPLGVLLFWDRKIPRELKGPLNGVLLLVGLLVIFMAGGSLFYLFGFRSIQLSLPAIVLVGTMMLINSRDDFVSRPIRNRIFILLMFASTLSLIQFPYSSGIYFCYVSPFSIFAVAGIVSRTTKYDRLLWGNLLMLATLFAVCWMNGSNPRTVGNLSQHIDQRVLLNVPRGGLWIAPSNYQETKSIVDFVHQQTEPADFILAGPDCPQFYFLSGRQNPTKHFYDLFQTSVLGSQLQLEQQLQSVVLEKDIKIIIINTNPEFSEPYGKEFGDWLQSWGQRVPLVGGRRFMVFQRN